MKSKILNISFVLAFLLCLSGCSSDTAESPQETQEISRDLLIGTWTRDGADIVFNNDGTGESEVFDFDSGDNTLQFQPLTWRLDSNVLTINFSVGTSVFQIIELAADNMQLQDANGVRRDYVKK